MIATLAELETLHIMALARLVAEISNPPVDDEDWKWGASLEGAARPSQGHAHQSRCSEGDAKPSQARL
jgi:hypothetical protein